MVREFKQAAGKDKAEVNSLVVKLFGDLKMEAPVAAVNGGNFRDSWKLVKLDEFTWEIENTANYASILWMGRRMGSSHLGNPKMYGSDQWPSGGEPMLKRFEYKLGKI